MPTIEDVATRAAVSKSTVSRAFSRPDSVRADTRERVLTVARELGYSPTRMAPSLARNRTGRRAASIGLFVPDIANPFFPPIIKSVQAQARRADLHVFVADSDEHADDEFAIIRSMAEQVDGLVLASPRMSDEAIRDVLSLVPTVLINRDVEGAPAAVLPDDTGLTQAVEHLVALGHERIVYLAGPEDSYSNAARRSALRAAATRLGADLTEMGPFRPALEAGARAAALVAAQQATAIIAYNDLVAMGLMSRLPEFGLTAGKDIAVIGIDDTWLAPMAQPPLTSVRFPGATAGTVAVRLLTDLIAQSDRHRPERYTVPTELIVRATTGPNSSARTLPSGAATTP
jgi:DNA-binding LacI/PurR family transcriptional regulator